MMRKLFYGFIALLAIAACSKESEQPVTKIEKGTRVVKIKASMDATTKTVYENDKTFSWEAGDKISVQVHYIGEETNVSEYDVLTFVTTNGGTIAEFSCDEFPEDYEIVSGGLAFYPSSSVSNYFVYNKDDNDGGPSVKFGSVTLNHSKTNPLFRLPLIGQLKGDKTTGEEYEYQFKTATGLVKVTIDNLPAEATRIWLYGSTNPLKGTYKLDEDHVLKMSNLVENTGSANTYIGISSAEEGESRSFYFHVPEGTIPAGTKLYLTYGTKNTILISKTLKSDIPVVCNTVTDLGTITAPSFWTLLGEGKYNDSFFLGSYTYYVDVNIYQNQLSPNRYIIENAYSKIQTALNYTPLTGMVGPEDKLLVTVVNNGEAINNSINADADGYVIWDRYYTGFDDYGDEIQMFHPLTPLHWNKYTIDQAKNSRVLRYDGAGVPAVIQLAPFYADQNGTKWYSAYNGISINQVVQIVFPNQNPIDASFDYTEGAITDNVPEHPAYTFSIDRIGVDAENVKVAFSAVSAEDALSNLNDGQDVTLGDVVLNLPANQPSGDIYVAVGSYRDNEVWITDYFSFEWINSNEDKGYTLADLLGTYTLSGKVYKSSSWVDGSITMTFEASDNAEKGNFMITALGSSYGDFTKGEGDGYTNIYGTFNTATGRITIKNMQPFCLLYSAYVVMLSYYGDQTSDLEFDLTEPGKFVLHTSGYFMIGGYYNSTMYYLDLFNTFTAVRNADPSSPAPSNPKQASVNALPQRAAGLFSEAVIK